MKRFLTGTPLARKFLKNKFHDSFSIPVQMLFSDFLTIRTLLKFILNLSQIPRIPKRVMSEVEVFSLVDGLAKPVGEIMAVECDLSAGKCFGIVYFLFDQGS